MKLLFTVLMSMQVYLTNASSYSKAVVANVRSGLLNGYNPYIRPLSTVNVTVGLTVLSMDLDSKEETFTASGKFTVIWYDQLWELRNYDVELFHAKEGEIWRPELVIENMVDDIAVVADENLMYRLHYTGVVTWEPAVNIKVHCSHDFTYYPFDDQTCGIIVSSWSYDHSETPLQPLSNQVNLNMYKGSSEFHVKETRVEASQVTETQHMLDRTYSKLTFYITVRRHSQFYGLTIILPLVLLSVLTNVTFLLPSETGEKSNYSMTVLLMIIIFYTMVYGYVPIFTGVCVLVVYAAVVLILATVAILCDLLVLYLYHQDKHREMTHSVRSVLHILARITFNHGPSDNTKSVVTSEETRSSRLSEHDLHACSSLPNGGLGGKKPGRLSPINRRVVPSETLVDNGDRLTHRDSVPPLNIGTQSDTTHRDSVPPLNTGTQSDTGNVIDLMKVTQLQTEKKKQLQENTDNSSPWQEISVCLDRLFFIIFVVLSFIIHLVFLILLGTGSA